MKLEVETGIDYVRILDRQGHEVCYWIQDEWIEDPSVTISIANAIIMAYENPEKLIEMSKKHIKSQE